MGLKKEERGGTKDLIWPFSRRERPSLPSRGGREQDLPSLSNFRFASVFFLAWHCCGGTHGLFPSLLLLFFFSLERKFESFPLKEGGAERERSIPRETCVEGGGGVPCLSLSPSYPLSNPSSITYISHSFPFFISILFFDLHRPKMTVYPPARSSAPATRVRVTAEESSEPRPIAPPTEVDEEGHRAISPPIRSFKMEEHENPFKPQDILYHEVDPIVEQYLHKPFPPSHPGSAHNTPVKHSNGHASLDEVKPRFHETSDIRESPAYYQNGLTRADIIGDEKKGYKDGSDPLIIETNQGRSHPSHSHHGGKVDGDLPPANQVELVHIKKKKCGCCSLQ